MNNTEILNAINKLDWAILHLQKHTLETAPNQTIDKTIAKLNKIKNTLKEII